MTAQIVYKPKDLLLDNAWHALIQRLNRGIGPIEAQGLRNVFDGGALLVRKIGRFRDPEEVGCDPR
jgi:hypothetical protein